MNSLTQENIGDESRSVAVIGMACRFPGADDIETFWKNLVSGVESIKRLTEEDMVSAGRARQTIADVSVVPAASIIDGIELFDPSFFGLTAREAEIMDPQHRVFLELAWHALEDAGYDPYRYKDSIGVFGGGIFNSYLTRNLVPAGVLSDPATALNVALANEKDYMVTRVAYKLNLRGPAYSVQSGCSTSLLAIHTACQNVLNYESDIALAGGISIDISRGQGYVSTDGGVMSPDGHCRPFDAAARGTVFGNGAGMVVLKRLDEAIADGDRILAVVRGSATNNDGSLKAGFTAPSVEGQAAAIAQALAAAGVEPASISFVEAHGTGTALGDPIELEALSRAFGDLRGKKCAIGSVKSNIGHLDSASGVSGFIKAVLSIRNGVFPPTLHFKTPNPNADWERTPFFVNSEPLELTSAGPRRAGVSSFGMGGTNVHAILEEPPVLAERTIPSRPLQLVLLSARSARALDSSAARLGNHLGHNTDTDLSDAAYTLQVGRAEFPHRLFVLGDDAKAVEAQLRDPGRSRSRRFRGESRPVAFLFPGQGSQYPGMARRLYQDEPAFRAVIDECARALKSRADIDLLSILFPSDPADGRINRTEFAQLALFVIEFALARLWMKWGIEPTAMIGHSIGEYVAAAISGVMSLEDALHIVAVRGRLMQRMPPGAMTAVALSAEALEPLVDDASAIAAVNAPSSAVASGPVQSIENLEAALGEKGILFRRLHTSHAFHSAMMEPIMDSFREAVKSIPLTPPSIPFVSNTSATWISDTDASDPEYWTRHLRAPVRFSASVGMLLQHRDYQLIEVGPGNILSSLAGQQLKGARKRSVLASLPHPADNKSDFEVLLESLGELWLDGATVDWEGFHTGQVRRRVSLPGYSFDRQRYWVDRPSEKAAERPALLGKREDVASWLYSAGWQQTAHPATLPRAAGGEAEGICLLLADRSAIADRLCSALERRGQRTVVIRSGSEYCQRDGEYFLDPARPEHFDRLLKDVAANFGPPSSIVHMFAVAGSDHSILDADAVDAVQARTFYSLGYLVRALETHAPGNRTSIRIVTDGAQDVTGSEILRPEQSLVVGPCLVIPQEHPNLDCCNIDIDPSSTSDPECSWQAEILADECLASSSRLVAHRNGKRWIRSYQPLKLAPPPPPLPRDLLRQNGIYLITGGLGTIGFALAQHLAASRPVRLILVNRTELPSAVRRDDWIAAHGPADKVSKRIKRVQALEASGATVELVCGNVGDIAWMCSVVSDVERRFGEINGVIHAAGIVDSGAYMPVTALDIHEWKEQSRAKLPGLFALQAALEGRRLDFCVVTSSLSAILGGLGYAAYSAANVFMNTFVARRNRGATAPWKVIEWDAWIPPDEVSAGGQLSRLALSASEGTRVFDMVWQAQGVDEVIVSTADLGIRAKQWITPTSTFEPSASDHGPRLYSRPITAPSDYAAPESQVEREIADIWSGVLGLAEVGRQDNFFDLGGNSLMAVQVLAKLNKKMGVKISIEEFMFQTVGQLAALCERQLTRR